MLKEVSKYSDLWPPKRMARFGRSSWPIHTYSPKVVESGQYPTLSPEILHKVRSDFIREVGAVFEGQLTGYRDYQDAISEATLAKTSRFGKYYDSESKWKWHFLPSSSSKTLRVEICN